jgi:hypothetical protein
LRLGAVLFAAVVVTLACSSASPEAFSMAAKDRAVDSAAKVDDAQLKRHVEALFAGRKAELPVTSRFSIEAPITHIHSAKYVEDAFRAAGYVPVVERSADAGMDATNVFVDIPGTLPEQVLVTGHHDAWYQAGADDNASAVAVLLEAARVLKDSKPKRTIRILALDREEEGSIGAARYLAAHEGEAIRLVVNLDCVAFAARGEGSQDAPPGLGLRDTGDFLAILANESARPDVTRVIGLAPQLPNAIEALGIVPPGDGAWPGTADFLRSDHAPFWLAGIRALFVTDTANFRNPNYHKASDTPETLDYAFFGSAARLVVGTVAAVAENDG